VFSGIQRATNGSSRLSHGALVSPNRKLPLKPDESCLACYGVAQRKSPTITAMLALNISVSCSVELPADGGDNGEEDETTEAGKADPSAKTKRRGLLSRDGGISTGL
jgi:hypothetical protein